MSALYYGYQHPSSRERFVSVAFTAAMHLMFFALLFVGVNWQRKIEPQINVVDLWNLPEAVQPVPPPPAPPPPEPEVKAVPQPVVPPPPVKAVPNPVPRPVVEKPALEKADIALKDKAEKARRAAEERRKEAKKREAAVRAAAQQKVAQEAEAQRVVREQEEAQRRVAEQAVAAQARLKAEYTAKIIAQIRRRTVLPPNMQGNPEAEFDIVVAPNGNVLSTRLKRSSGDPTYDRNVENAIKAAQPLPMPADPALAQDLRELNLHFRPQQ